MVRTIFHHKLIVLVRRYKKNWLLHFEFSKRKLRPFDIHFLKIELRIFFENLGKFVNEVTMWEYGFLGPFVSLLVFISMVLPPYYQSGIYHWFGVIFRYLLYTIMDNEMVK